MRENIGLGSSPVCVMCDDEGGCCSTASVGIPLRDISLLFLVRQIV